MATNADTEKAIIRGVNATLAFSDETIVGRIIHFALGFKEGQECWINISNRERVASFHWKTHFRLCHWTDVEYFIVDGKHVQLHPTGMLDPKTGKIEPHSSPARNELYCTRGRIDGSLYELVEVPLSVLRLRLICKATDEEVRKTFWTMCRFVGKNPALLHDMLQGITATLGPNDPRFANSTGPAQIKKLALHFRPGAPPSYEEIAKRLPHLQDLNLFVYHDEPHEFEETRERNTPASSLVNVKGLKDLAIALRKHCPDLSTIECFGKDYIRVTSRGGRVIDLEHDINDDRCIGPTLKYNMLRGDGDRGDSWLTADDIANRTKANNKRPPMTTNKTGAAPTRGKKRTAATSAQNGKSPQMTKKRKSK